MNTFNIDTLQEGVYFTDKVFLDKTFLLFDSATPITKKLLEELDEWGFKQISCEGMISVANIPKEPVTEKPQENNTKTAEKAENEIKSILAQASDLSRFSDEDRIKLAEKVYNGYLNYITNVYTHFSTHMEFDIEGITQKIKNLCTFIDDNGKYILRITQRKDAPSRTYLVNHAMRCIVLSLAIGLQLRMSLQKLVELGVTAMLHEIGMLRIPPQLYLTDKPLKPKDKNQLMTHPLLGFQILKDSNFPLSIQLGTLEHHERENGTGYPRALTGEKISLYGKIVSVTCVYDAIVSPRTYKIQKTSHQAILELLRNESRQFDPTIIKALLFCLSLYPIGTYVFMENGKIAMVTDANPLNFKNPVVQIVGETDQQGNPLTIQTNENMKISRVLTDKEIEDLTSAAGISRPS